MIINVLNTEGIFQDLNMQESCKLNQMVRSEDLGWMVF